MKHPLSFRWWVLASALLVLLTTLGLPDWRIASAQTTCRFTLGFKALHDRIPVLVGGCLEDEHFNPQNGNAEQRTGGGLLVWRKADNWTAFTDGATTWISGPAGLVSRPNAGPLFPWEAVVPSPVVVDPDPTEELLVLAPEPALAAPESAPRGVDPTVGPRVFRMAESLQPAWQTLIDLKDLGADYKEMAPKSLVWAQVAPLPDQVNGVFQARLNIIMINAALLREDRRTIAAVLAHELTHAIDAAFFPERMKDCIGEEVSAHVQEAKVWQAFWQGSAPNKTRVEQYLNGLLRLWKAEGRDGIRRALQRNSAYREQCDL